MGTHQKSYTLIELIESFSLNPRHIPTRWETTDGFQDSDCPNHIRAELAKQRLCSTATTREGELDPEIEISDLICNLLHLAHSKRYDPLNVRQRAVTHFIAEAGNVNTADS